MKKQQRIVWIDQLRAIAFIFVILGHMTINKSFESWIYSFHMPMFFMISGLTMNIEKIYNTDFKKYFSAQFQRLVIPYVWIQFICLLAICILNAVTNGKPVAVGENIKGIFVANGLILAYPSRAMYFVIVLFLAQICLWLIIRITKGNYISMAIICLAFSFISENLEGERLVWRVNVVPAAVLMIFIGKLFMDLYQENREKLESMNALKYGLLCTVLFVIGVICWQINGRISMAGNKYGKSFMLAILCSVLTSIAIALIAMKLPKITVLITVGKSTILYMGLHKLLITLLERWFSDWKGTLPFVIVVCAFIFFALILAVRYCEKFCPYLLARPTGDDNIRIIIGKIINILICVFVPYFFIVNKFFDLTVTANMAAATVLYLVSCTIAYFVLQAMPYIYIQDKSNIKKLKRKSD